MQSHLTFLWYNGCYSYGVYTNKSFWSYWSSVTFVTSQHHLGESLPNVVVPEYIAINITRFVVLGIEFFLFYWYPVGLLHWHWGNHTIAPVPVKQPHMIWVNVSCECSWTDHMTTTKQSTTKQCMYFILLTVPTMFVLTSFTLWWVIIKKNNGSSFHPDEMICKSAWWMTLVMFILNYIYNLNPNKKLT